MDALSAARIALRGSSEVWGEHRDARLRDTLERAAAAPLAIGATGCDVAVLAAEFSRRCDPDLRADVAGAAAFGEVSARVSADLVAVSLATTTRDLRLAAARVGRRPGGRGARARDAHPRLTRDVSLPPRDVSGAGAG